VAGEAFEPLVPDVERGGVAEVSGAAGAERGPAGDAGVETVGADVEETGRGDGDESAARLVAP